MQSLKGMFLFNPVLPPWPAHSLSRVFYLPWCRWLMRWDSCPAAEPIPVRFTRRSIPGPFKIVSAGPATPAMRRFRSPILPTRTSATGSSLVVDTNVPAWLQYNVYESDGTSNLTVNVGTVMFWFGPASWSGTNAGGTGPGQWSQLIDVGEWTPGASSGYWGLAVDPPGANLWFLAQDGAGDTYSLSAPIAWTTNYFHSTKNFLVIKQAGWRGCQFLKTKLR
jgi:hypothetical protein